MYIKRHKTNLKYLQPPGFSVKILFEEDAILNRETYLKGKEKP